MPGFDEAPFGSRDHLIKWLIPSGIGIVDQAAGGLRAGELTVVTAVPGCGVSSLLYEVALYTAVAFDRRVLVATGSATPSRIAGRLLMSASGVPTPAGPTDSHSPEQERRLQRAQSQLAEASLTIVSAPTDVLMAAGSGDFDVLVVDDLGAHAAAQPDATGDEGFSVAVQRPSARVGAYARKLKLAAVRSEVPIIAGVPAPTAAPGVVVRLEELPDWQVADAADVVLGLHRTPKDDIVEVTALKNRHGRTGELGRLGWISKTAKLANLATRHPTAPPLHPMH